MNITMWRARKHPVIAWLFIMLWPTVWGLLVAIFAPRSTQENCAFDHDVAITLVVILVMPWILGLRSRWFRARALMIGLIWAAFIAYILTFTAGALCSVYSRVYLEVVDPERKCPRYLQRDLGK